MRVLKSKLTRRVLILGFALIVVVIGISILNGTAQKVVGVVGSYLPKFCDDYSNPICTKFITWIDVTAAAITPYQNVQGDVTISGGKLTVSGGDIFIDGARTIRSPDLTGISGRMHIFGGEILYLLNKGGTTVSRAWGGNGNLMVEGEIIADGSNSWIIHTPDDYRTGEPLYITPKIGGVWDWGKQTAFFNDGGVYFSGKIGIGRLPPPPASLTSLDISGGDINIDDGRTIYSRGRMNIHGDGSLYLFNIGGTIVSKGWGGNGNLTVEGDLTTEKPIKWKGTDNQYVKFNNFNNASQYIEFTDYESGGAWGITAWASSKELKNNITDLNIDTNKIYELKSYSYNYKTDPDGTPKTFGLMAEEVAQIIPELVANDSEGKPHHVKLDQLSVLLLNEMKKQKAELNALSEKVEAQQREIEFLKQEIEQLKAR